MASILRQPLKLGRLTLQSPALLAPLESVTDCGYRNLCYANGAGITFTEMVRASAVGNGNSATLAVLDTFDSGTMTGMQMTAKTPTELRMALEKLDELARTDEYQHFRNIRAIDLNFGCPSPTIINIGCGPAMLKRRAKMRELFDVLVMFRDATLSGGVGGKQGGLMIGAISAKIRLGMSQKEKGDDRVYLGVIESAVEAGLDFCTVHGRHAKQTSTDLPDWGSIGECVELARQCRSENSNSSSEGLKIIGNGNVFDYESASRMVNETGVDGVMIARGEMM